MKIWPQPDKTNTVSGAKKKSDRYPGDIVDFPNMSKRQLEECVQICKKKNTYSGDILEQLKEGRKTRSYSKGGRSFFLPLNFYSSAVYMYIRRKFGNHLPAPNTIRNWYSNLNGEPGICTEKESDICTK
ncbi:hypothetical protein Bhyg_17566 [Pseudolycoriella hygida]|uniref:THAP9-like helix-turn-helix domain-containing protein n=1 Tax=Pseudolycoriella hygida TaxID=35572 RepID=A0A9Q0RTU2_9DIPT|nr:hypothetical protein Bhyg_17566 [Pseudolycoriella hygida]